MLHNTPYSIKLFPVLLTQSQLQLSVCNTLSYNIFNYRRVFLVGENYIYYFHCNVHQLNFPQNGQIKA